MSQILRPLGFRQRAFLGAGLAFIVVLILWNVPQLDFILYPFRLFVTFVHESGHGLAAILTGGVWSRFEVMPSGAGFAVTAGGSRAVILAAGYLGAAFFGAALFYLANRVPHTRVISVALGIGLIAISWLYGGLFTTAFFVGTLMGIILIVLARRAHPDVNLIVLNILAMLTGLNAVLDVISLVSNTGATLGAIRNDAAAFSAEIAPLIPAVVWAALWALIAVAMVGVSVYASLIRRR